MEMGACVDRETWKGVLRTALAVDDEDLILDAGRKRLVGAGVVCMC